MTNARFLYRLAAKQSMHSVVIPNWEPKNLNEEGHDDDPYYEGLEDSKDITTAIKFSAKDEGHTGKFPRKETLDARPMTDLVKWKTSRKTKVRKERDVLDKALVFALQTKILGIDSPANTPSVTKT